MKVAIVCDWLTGIGGAERVVLALHEMYPDAPIYTSQYDPAKIDWFKDADVRTLWLQKLPKSLKKFLPALRAFAFSRLNLSDYDLVISSSGAEAKGIKTGPNTVHVSYIHSPTHYYWIRQEEYLDNPGFPLGLNWLARLGFKFLEEPLKRWDKMAAKHPDYIVTNSNYSKDNILKFYKRESTVIYPPVDVSRFKGSFDNPRHGFVIAGRQTPYKRFDLAIKACNELKIPLVVIGNGPEHKKLEKLADKNTVFLTQANDEVVKDQFKSALGFIFPNQDDFGIVAVEALASGTPVAAYKAGGALDYIKEGMNGVFFDKQDEKSLVAALNKLLQNKFNYAKIADAATEFDVKNFKKDMLNFINERVKK